jgi:AraC-like DNA-binding protein
MTSGANPLTSRAMNQGPEGPPTPVLQFRAWIDAFERLGYDVGRLLSDVGFERLDLDDPDMQIPCAVVGAFFERSQRAWPLKNLWTRLAAETPIGAFRLLDYLIVTSDNIREAYRQFARYSWLVGAPLAIDIREDEDPIRVAYVMAAWVPACCVEYSVALDVRALCAETETPVSFAYASFLHQPDDVSEIERLLGCPVRSCASWAGVALTREAWQAPLKRRDPVLRGVLQSQADAITPPVAATNNLPLHVRRVLAPRLARGQMEIDVVARDLGMSSRTLQRRLAVAGRSYQELLDMVRRETAERYIADRSLSIGEVAYLVGYSEPAAFHRAFKRWTGVTPQAFRQQRGNEGALTVPS